MLENLMQEFSRELGVGNNLASGTPGVYKLPLEDEVSITISALPPGFILSCPFAPCPKNNREFFFSQALLADLFGQGTHGAVIGISEEGNNLTLSKVIDYNINYKEFRDTIEDFINIVDYWRGEALAQTG